MQCPIGDGELIAHTTHGEHGLTISYSNCPVCRGYWAASFAANFIKLPPSELVGQPTLQEQDMHCPVCRKPLERTTGDNIPDAVYVFMCPDGHGYFFPTGQLAAWKNAQSAKITYHKLWNIPLPSVASVLLTGFLVVVLTGGLIVGLRGVQNQQNTASQAQQTLYSHLAHVEPGTHDVLLSAQTQENLTLTVHVPKLDNFEGSANTDDGRTHYLLVKAVPSGTYEYYFTWVTSGKTIRSDTYTFVMP